MNILVVVGGGALILFLAYLTYGKFISTKVFELDNSRVTLPLRWKTSGLCTDRCQIFGGSALSAIAAAGPGYRTDHCRYRLWLDAYNVMDPLGKHFYRWRS